MECEYKIWNVNARFPGSSHDSFIWKQCSIRTYLLDNYGNERRWLLGDSGYPLEPILLVPFRNAQNPGAEMFNERHRQCHSTVERCIGNKKINLDVWTKLILPFHIYEILILKFILSIPSPQLFSNFRLTLQSPSQLLSISASFSVSILSQSLSLVITFYHIAISLLPTPLNYSITLAPHYPLKIYSSAITLSLSISSR